MESALLEVPQDSGSDAGFEQVVVTESQGVSPLVIVDDLRAMLPYAVGAVPGISLYPQGFGAPNRLLLRSSLAEKLREADKYLRPFGMRLLILDGFRSMDVQAKLFTDIYGATVGRAYHSGDSPTDVLRGGINTNIIASCAPILRNQAFQRLLDQESALASGSQEFAACCSANSLTAQQGVEKVVVYRANLDRTLGLEFDLDGNTTHGCGGSVDVWLLHTDGRPVMLGTAFDSVSPAATFDFFEDQGNWDIYRGLVAKDGCIQRYLRDNNADPTNITDELCQEVRRNRRILYQVMCRQLELTTYSFEFWHFNGDGSPCSAIIVAKSHNPGVDPKDVTATWSTRGAHEQAARLFAV